jgi:hypothetical protein
MMNGWRINTSSSRTKTALKKLGPFNQLEMANC